MKPISIFGRFLPVPTLIGCILLYQNCGPAQLKVGSSASKDLSSHVSPVTTSSDPVVGSKVDLTTFSKAPLEEINNVLYPFSAEGNFHAYTLGTPVMENVVLRNNNFTKIFWVHAPTQAVVAVGAEFNRSAFASSDIGNYYVFGLRGESLYTLSRFSIVNRTSTAMPVNSPDAVVIAQKVVFSDDQNEYILVSVEAPNVELKSVQFNLKSMGISVSGRRALLVNKKINEVFDLDVQLTDIGNQSLSKILALPAKTLPPSGTTPTPTPTPTSTPTPVATVTPVAGCSTAPIVVTSLGDNAGTMSPLKVTLTSSVPAGTLLVAQVAYRSYFERTVSDSKGNTWKLAAKATSSTLSSSIFYTKTTVPMVSGDDIILSDALTNAGLGMAVLMVKGASTLDQTGSDANPSAPAVTTAGAVRCANEVLVGVAAHDNVNVLFEEGGGFNLNYVWAGGITGGTGAAFGYRTGSTLSGPQRYAPQTQPGSGTAYTSVIATFY